MLFTSPVYLVVFLPVTVAAYWLVPRQLRLAVLLVASYVFYVSWRPLYALLLVASTLVNYGVGRRGGPGRRGWLVLGVTFNLVVLAYFKYAGLLTRTGADAARSLGILHGGFDGLHVVLPLAISFFTFEMISVQIDVYRGEVHLERFLDFAVYKAYFPKLIAGPITRYGELVPQLRSPQPLTLDRFQSGIALFTRGLAKKLVVADNLAVVANPVFDAPASYGGGAALTAVLAFGVQIYFDFSGYTDMARGASRLLGLELPLNFLLPYAATSPSDFWRRWHISLSRWLRDYLYIPLGGNRKGRVRTYVNLAVTMVLGGLWHGAAWHFAAWGGLHGSFLTASHSLRNRYRTTWLLRRLGWALTMGAVFFAWIFFRAPSLGAGVDLLHALGRRPLGLGEQTPLAQVGVGVPYALVLAALVAYLLAVPALPATIAWLRATLADSILLRRALVAAMSVALWTSAGLLAAPSKPPFIYFRF